MELKFFKCGHCGQIIEKVKDTNVDIICCGDVMKELHANSTDAAVEKHVPVVEQNGNNVKVTVGSVIHPMTEAHYIEWVVVTTEKNVYKHVFNCTDEPVCAFEVQEGEHIDKVYAYCNLHGLWQSK